MLSFIELHLSRIRMVDVNVTRWHIDEDWIIKKACNLSLYYVLS